MTPGEISKRVVVDRLEWIDRMITEIQSLPLANLDEFMADTRNIWSAESCLRRGLEALFDLGRHILAKGFGQGASEFKEIASGLAARGVISEDDRQLMHLLAEYRNRLVHFYHEVDAEELYQICRSELGDLRRLVDALRNWAIAHPEKLDDKL
jgi:uncharacterized protein YutE (UPF0331/DUF86 family)